MTKKQKFILMRIITAAVLLAAVIAINPQGILRPIMFAVPYLIIGYDILLRAVRGILRGEVFDENFLMSIATLGAMIIGEYPEGSAVMLFYQTGELFQDLAVAKSRKSIGALMDICPESANLEREGEITVVSPDEVSTGDIIVLRPGDRVPLDSVVLSGNSSLDMSALTGEAQPVRVSAGDNIISGSINLTGVLRAEVRYEYSDSTVAKILGLIENSSEKKARIENFITRFAKYYTPAVVTAAAVFALLSPFIFGDGFIEGIHRALIFLVISCPCALVISVPMTFFSAIGCASKCGILIKGANYIEALAKIKTVVFDKTGTLTHGTFEVTQTVAYGCSERELLEIAAVAESASDHPIALSLRRAYGLETVKIHSATEIAGEGICAQTDGKTVYVGNARLMQRAGVTSKDYDGLGTVVHVAADKKYLGYIVISDKIKADSKKAVSDLKSISVSNIVMLTGDSAYSAEAVGKKLGIDTVFSELLPADKVECAETLIAGKEPGSTLAFVGDGINDAPVLTRADIGIAMGAIGSDAAIEAADVVIMDDKPSKIVLAIKISKQAAAIVRQNVIFALGVKAAVMSLGAAGFVGMWAAVFADVGVAVLAILNAMRAMKIKNN